MEIRPPSFSQLKTVFLDRDGVINEKQPEGHYVGSLADFHVLDGVPEAIVRLNRAGMRVIVVSNQRGIALGKYTEDDVQSIHAQFDRILHAHGGHIDAYLFCPHDKLSCNCRKPLRGLFDQAVLQFPDIEPSSSVMIGDSLSDIEFGRNLGIHTIFIAGDPGRRKPGAEKAEVLADLCCSSLPDAVEKMLVSRVQYGLSGVHP